jgi:hypothetical protein
MKTAFSGREDSFRLAIRLHGVSDLIRARDSGKSVDGWARRESPAQLSKSKNALPHLDESGAPPAQSINDDVR